MKIEVSIGLLKDFIDNCNSCNNCKYLETDCAGKSCRDSIFETIIEKSQLILDFDSAILELEKQKRKCTEKQAPGLLFAITILENIKKEFQQTKEK